MKDQEKAEYLEEYKEDKKKGIPFWPDALFKDALVGLIAILVLVGLSMYYGAPLEELADPADSNYTPKPEWYFLFVFQLLKYFPGSLEVLGVVVVPGIAIGLLVALPYLDKTKERHWANRPMVAGFAVVGMLVVGWLTVQSILEAPPPGEAAPEDGAGDVLAQGESLFDANCSACHGQFGEGGPNPINPVDVIPPISTANYLGTRDDTTLRLIVSKGQPDQGMSPFALAEGGPLRVSQVDAVVAYMRSWEANPPVEASGPGLIVPATLTPIEMYNEVCARCHSIDGSGGIGPSLIDPVFQALKTDDILFNVINLGHDATSMIGWGDVLTSTEIKGLVAHLRTLGGWTTASESVDVIARTFEEDVKPIFDAKCLVCHGTSGGWDGSTFEGVMTSGDNAPSVVPGDSDGSLLAQKVRGTQQQGGIMPPGAPLPDSELRVILDWIASGAKPGGE